MNVAFVFGNLGNAASCLGKGWSTEDDCAWAIGSESTLTLPLPLGSSPGTLRFEVRPALFPSVVDRQRLTIRAGHVILAQFELDQRDIIAVPLPAHLVPDANLTEIELTLLHPDAARPNQHGASDDVRALAICFYSVTLTDWTLPESSRTQTDGPDPVQGIVAGDVTAMIITNIINKLPSLRGRLHLRRIDPSDPIIADPSTRLCWLDISQPAGKLRQSLPQDCAIRTFYVPQIQALWPFQGPDPRAIAEPGRYCPSRYPFGDRLALPLAGMNLPDDVIYLMYDMAVEQDNLDLDALFAADLQRWRQQDTASDIRLADFIQANVRAQRLFVSPRLPAPALLRHMAGQMLDDVLFRDLVSSDVIAAELDALLDGYCGTPQELPLHHRVAEHFALSWWSPQMRYGWMNNHHTYRDYILDYVRWVHWRP